MKSHVFLARVEAWDGRSHGNISEVLSGFLHWLLWLLIADDESFGAVQKAMSMFENGVIENDLHDAPKRRF